jgi:hypothetical protein
MPRLHGEQALAWLDSLQDLRKARQEATSPKFHRIQ